MPADHDEQTVSDGDGTFPHTPLRQDDPPCIGPYRILQKLGEGGMGVVYEAEQVEPIRRRVALKIIKLGMDTKEVVARFEAERQALAVMDHPNIAQVYDGGCTETGRPYFVMELVRGIPINEYSDKHRLSTAARLELFIPTCHAIHHAHQKGVVHRDLKPTNVLVSVHEGRAVPNVIDFGIAKAIGHRLTDRTLVTEMGRPVGTPEYMSPEQAEMSGLDVDTRSDVYSLGVMLYELLTGTLPFDLRQVASISPALQYVLRERDPPTPSRRYDSLGDRRETIAVCRQTDPSSLSRVLRGDLDWVVMTAMAKDRTRRYESAAALAADIRRHLDHEVVTARPPTARYRLGKFSRRHRAGVAATAIATLAVLGGVTATTIGFVRARAAESATRQEAATAKQVSDFVVGLFNLADPGEARGNSITAREILDKGAADIKNDLQSQPAVRGRLMAVIGNVYRSLGLYGEAGPLIEEALAVQRETLGSNHLDVSRTLRQLATVRRMEGKTREAVPPAEEALAIALAVLGPDHLETAEGHLVLGINLRRIGEYEAARTHLERSLAIRERELGPDHMETAWSRFHLAWLHHLLGEDETAKAIYVRTIPVAEKELGTDHPEMASFLLDYGTALSSAGEHEEARRHYLRALAIRENALGPDHHLVSWVLNNLGNLEWRVGDLEAAQRYYERSLAIKEKALGPNNIEVGTIVGNLAFLLHRRGKYAESKELYERALVIEERVLGADHLTVANTLNNFAWLLRDIGHLARAQSLLEQVLALRTRVLGLSHARLIPPLTHLGYVCRDLGDYPRSRHYIERRLAITEGVEERNDRTVATTLTELAEVQILMGDLDAALPALKRALALWPDYRPAVLQQAKLYHAQRNAAKADSLFARWLELSERDVGAESADFAVTRGVYWTLMGNHDKAVEFFRVALERGYKDPWLIRHPDLFPLRGDPEFGVIVTRLKRRLGIDGLGS